MTMTKEEDTTNSIKTFKMLSHVMIKEIRNHS